MYDHLEISAWLITKVYKDLCMCKVHLVILKVSVHHHIYYF